MTEIATPASAATDEARRQAEICNACRYCEGYCSVFPLMFRSRTFADADIVELANLCHNCRGCYYACQYAPPHAFALNLPRALAEVRAESWQRYAWPSALARLFQRSGVALVVAIVLAVAAIFLAMGALRPTGGRGFYAVLSHGAMVAIFTPLFLLPFLAMARGLARYWREVGGERVRLADLAAATGGAARLDNLAGGHGEGCNFEAGDRFTNTRRFAHQATAAGFLLCFAATASGTLYHYGLGWEAPYSLFSLPKLFGVPGGVLLTAGALALGLLKVRADPDLGAPDLWGGDIAFVLTLALTGATGLMLYAAGGTPLVPVILALHLGTVAAFFLTTPYSKMAHAFYRFAALVRDAQRRR